MTSPTATPFTNIGDPSIDRVLVVNRNTLRFHLTDDKKSHFCDEHVHLLHKRPGGWVIEEQNGRAYPVSMDRPHLADEFVDHRGYFDEDGYRDRWINSRSKNGSGVRGESLKNYVSWDRARALIAERNSQIRAEYERHLAELAEAEATASTLAERATFNSTTPPIAAECPDSPGTILLKTSKFNAPWTEDAVQSTKIIGEPWAWTDDMIASAPRWTVVGSEAADTVGFRLLIEHESGHRSHVNAYDRSNWVRLDEVENLRKMAREERRAKLTQERSAIEAELTALERMGHEP